MSRFTSQTSYDRAAMSYGRVGPPRFAHFGQRLAGLADLLPEMSVLAVHWETLPLVSKPSPYCDSDGGIQGNHPLSCLSGGVMNAIANIHGGHAPIIGLG